MRYQRQEIHPGIGKAGQKKIERATMAIIGTGALGSVSAELAARAGVGHILLIDRDIVELSNLQRQSLFTEADIGKPKASAAKAHLESINSTIRITAIDQDIDNDTLSFSSKKTPPGLILDCTDNMETRYLLNDYARKHEIPFIYASAIQSKGYVFVTDKETPCLRCFLNDSTSYDTCDTQGVMNTIIHIISALQVGEALKIITGKKTEDKLLFVDSQNNTIEKIKVTKNLHCECCGKRNFEFLEKDISTRPVKLCGRGMFQIKKPVGKKEYHSIKNKLTTSKKVHDLGTCISVDGKLTFFPDGRALIRAGTEKEARSLYSKIIGN